MSQASKREAVVDGFPEWSYRFFALNENIGVELCAVFRGKEADLLRDLPWPEKMRHSDDGRDEGGVHYPQSLRFYLSPDSDGAHGLIFDYSELLRLVRNFGLELSLFHWTFMRCPWVKAFCMRESEIQDFERRGLTPPKWGFGRPHPYKDNFRSHKLLAGPLTDFRPGFAPKEFGEWSFEPVFVKTLTEDGSGHSVFVVRPNWTSGNDGATALIRAEELSDILVIPAAVLNGRL